MPPSKTLYILRHAKAEPAAANQDDHESGLNERRTLAGLGMGKYFVRQLIMPDNVLCSTAERAFRTWAYVQEAYKQPPSVEYSERLYLASANETVTLLSATDENIRQLMIVGHNPGL